MKEKYSCFFIIILFHFIYITYIIWILRVSHSTGRWSRVTVHETKCTAGMKKNSIKCYTLSDSDTFLAD